MPWRATCMPMATGSQPSPKVIARALRLDEVDRMTIRAGAYLHDLGMSRVPHEILDKAGPLTPEEMQLVRAYPAWGVEILADAELPWNVRPIIRSHHERYDGTGYPDRLAGDDVPLHAQIVGIADVYDSILSPRNYRPALDPERGMLVMYRSRHWWSRDVFEAFARAVAS